MRASEFRAMVEDTPDRPVWEPTADDLHRMFWLTPLPKIRDIPARDPITRACDPSVCDATKTGDARTPGTRGQRTVVTSPHDSRAGTSVRIFAAHPPLFDRETPPKRHPAPLPEEGFRLEVESAGVWFVVDGSESQSDEYLRLVRLPAHQRAQPHVRFRVASFRR